MTRFEVAERVVAILKVAADDEHAHILEDALYQDVLKAIAEGTCEDAASCARLALRTQDIEFARGCA